MEPDGDQWAPERDGDQWGPEPAPPSTARDRRRWGGGAGLLVVAAAIVAGGMAGGVVASVLDDDTSDSPSTTTDETSPSGLAFPDVEAIIERVQPSVVAVTTVGTVIGPFGRPITREGAGTGFVLTADGAIATNAHVVDGATSIAVTLADGTRLPATVIGADTGADLAVLQVDRTGLVPLPLGSSRSLRVGAPVIAIGNALALAGGPTASFGIASALDRSVTTSDGATYEHLVQTDAAINSGDSGGPLVDREGRVVGINTAAVASAENIGFAIAIDQAAPILERLRTSS